MFSISILIIQYLCFGCSITIRKHGGMTHILNSPHFTIKFHQNVRQWFPPFHSSIIYSFIHSTLPPPHKNILNWMNENCLCLIHCPKIQCPKFFHKKLAKFMDKKYSRIKGLTLFLQTKSQKNRRNAWSLTLIKRKTNKIIKPQIIFGLKSLYKWFY